MTDSTPIPTVPASHLALAQTPGTATFSTLGADGYPQSTAISFFPDGEVFRTSLHRTRQKYRNVVRHPHATLFLIDPADVFHTLEIRGDVSIEDDADLVYLTRQLAHYGRTLDSFGPPKENRVVLTLTPRRVVVNG